MGNSSLVANCSASLAKTRATGLPRICGLKTLAMGVSNGSICVGKGPSRIMPREKKRATPSGFMMKGPTSPGLAVGAMSGTS
ncbi:hypothetical protein D9M69_547420 [compost metagenome]